jgi:aspartyl/asparaginyl-tRNA synthetase
MFTEAADGSVRESGTGVGFDRLIGTMTGSDLNA